MNNGAAVSGGQQYARMAFALLAAAFALCVAVQVFLAGMAVFVNPLNWARHTGFVHVFELLPVVMLALAFAGRLPAALRWQSAGLLGLIMVMYATANMGGRVPWAAAAHPVMALAVFWVAAVVVGNSWRLVIRPASVRRAPALASSSR